MNRLRCKKPNLKINKYSLVSNVSLVSIKRTLIFCIPIKVVMIQCQFMLLKMIIPKRNHRLPTLMTLKLYRNEIIFPPSREDKLGRISIRETLVSIISKKEFSVSPKSRKRRKSATKKKIICTGRGCRCGTAFATRKLLLAHYMERQCYKCKKCDMSFQSGR